MNRTSAFDFSSSIAACALPLVLFSSCFAQEATLFSLGPDGPSGLPANIIFRSAPDSLSSPMPVGGAEFMGLMSPDDVIGSFSQRVEVEGPFLFCFSVTPETVGGVPPLIDFPFPGISFNVADQAENDQQAGDAFISTAAFDRGGGPLAGPEGVANNVLVINQSATYPNFFGLLPSAEPDDDVGPGKLDDVRGGAIVPTGGPGPLVADLYFTLDISSPSLGALSGAAAPSSANVFFDPSPGLDTGMPGDEGLFAAAADLGLDVGDSIDALSVFDDDADGAFTDGDQILFSLAPGSPSLGFLGAAPGDVLSVTQVMGMPALAPFAAGTDLGLDTMTGDVNMLVPVPLDGLTPIQRIQAKLTPIPEPAGLSLWGLAAICCVFARRWLFRKCPAT